MKEFRKNKDLFICEECGKNLNSLSGLSRHIFNSHKNLTKKEYFDKWIKEDYDAICKICEKETQFISLIGYKKCCCKKHIDAYAYQCRKEQMKIHYGVENVFQLENVKEKSKQTMLKNHGVEHALQSTEIKNNMKTNLLKDYGVDHNFKINDVIVNRKQTWTENYGYDNPSKSPVIKKQKEDTCLKHHGVKAGFADIEKCKKIWIEKYGVENPTQNKEIHEKQQRKSNYCYNYKNTNIHYRGTYELDFLEKYYEKYLDIQNGPTIRYEFKRKKLIYFPDFYIPSLNLIIECKNSYLVEKDKEQIEAKEKAVLENNFKYIMITNKDYIEFEKLIK